MRISFTIKSILLFLLISTSNCTISQKQIAEFSKNLNETSALTCLPDGKFITLNDSGNESYLFVFNLEGKVVHKCLIENAPNVDWEAMAFDGDNRLFIGDIGNNKNNRKNLAIYEVVLDKVLNENSTTAKKFSFSYPDQKAFPPEKPELYYDAEGMVYKNDSIFIFTKNRTVPFDGVVKVYAVPLLETATEAIPYPDLNLPATSWLEDSVTDAFLDGNRIFLLTYSKIYVFEWLQNGKWKKLDELEFDGASQKEGICFQNETIYITAEKSILGKASLYKIPYAK